MKKRMLLLSLGFILAGAILTRIGPYGTQNNLEDNNEKIEEQVEEQVVELVEVDEPTIPYVKDVNILDYYSSDGIVVVKTEINDITGIESMDKDKFFNQVYKLSQYLDLNEIDELQIWTVAYNKDQQVKVFSCTVDQFCLEQIKNLNVAWHKPEEMEQVVSDLYYSPQLSWME